MKVAKLLFSENKFVKEHNQQELDYQEAQLVLGFGHKAILAESNFYELLKKKFPKAEIALCSSSGEIFCNEVFDDTVAITAVKFNSSTIKTAEISVGECKNCYEAGAKLMQKLPQENLKWAFVLSDGSNVNGSELVKGLNSKKPENVLISGGLAGDGANFESTLVGLNSAPSTKRIIIIGFYGEKLQLSHGSFGGWESFGLERVVTKSAENLLFEIDGKDALDLYKKYLGKYAEELPGSALLFPLSIKTTEEAEPVVRTILSIDEKNNTMVFAGDIPEGSKVRFMKANFDRLIDAATDAAKICTSFYESSPKLAILISCVGRKLILGDRISEEVDAIADVFGNEVPFVGFYSYGEISPIKPFANCELHNQTMTITAINELD